MTDRLPKIMLFVPASQPRFFAKADERGAGAIILDLEDAVAADDKAAARNNLAGAAAIIRTPLFVRVNRVHELIADDIEAAVAAGAHGLVLPKVDDPTEIAPVLGVLEAAERRHDHAAPLVLVPMIESARALIAAGEIASASRRVRALAFGSEDLALDLGVMPSEETLAVPFQTVAIAARVAGVGLYGVPGSIGIIDDRDAWAGLVGKARRLGAAGVFCIHPGQVAAADAAFRPTQKEIAWAKAVVATADSPLARVDGGMVDAPVLQRARAILAEAAQG